MMKYLQLKNGRFIPEHIITSIRAEDGEIYINYMDGPSVAGSYAEQAEPCTIDSVIVALRRRIAEQQE
jgi:hypothetical protein